MILFFMIRLDKIFMRKKISKRVMKKPDEMNGGESEEELYVERIRLESMDMRLFSLFFLNSYLWFYYIGLMHYGITFFEDPCFKYICNFTCYYSSCLILLLL
jgi:hypothetical protein